MSWLALSGCDMTIHEYPATHDIQIVVECSVDLTAPEYFATVECEPEKGTSYVVRAQQIMPQGTRFTEPVCLRYIVDLYRITSSHSIFVERQVYFADVEDPNPQAKAVFNVNAEQYKVLVWCDYVKDDERTSWYYNTDDLRKIVYSDVEVLDNNDKDVFTNMLDVDLREYFYSEGHFEFVYPLELERPKGRFKCITTDKNDYIKEGKSAEDITAVVQYVQYVSAGYNVEEQKPNYFEPTRTFITKAHFDKDGELELFYDYVFVNGKQTNVKLNMMFFDGEVSISDSGEIVGEKISQWTGISVPLKRNMETIIEGRMLTTSFGTGGFGINPEFDKEIVIEWGD
jgi:hypothetical protein